MRSRTRTTMLALAVAALATAPAAAKPNDFPSRNQVRRQCTASGGAFWQQGPTTATYGCIRPNGSGVVCGGVTAEQKRSCSTFRTSAFRVPTREDADRAAVTK